MKILITGINGYIGSELKDFFLRKNYKVFGIKSKTKKKDYSNLIKKKIKPDVIIHCAGSGLVGINKFSYKTHKQKNLESTKELVNFINKSNLKNSKIIFLSSQAVYGKIFVKKISEKVNLKPISNYGKTKVLAEKELKKIKNNFIIILRLFSIYGVGLKKQIVWDACKKFKSKKITFRGTGLEKRDFLNIKDFKKLIKLIIYSKSEKYNIYNVGSGKGIEIKKLINKIKFYFKIYNKIEFVSEKNIAENQNYISLNKKITEKFKWKPTSKLNLEIKNYVNWFKKI